MQSFLRWAGSKRKLLPILREFCPPFTGRYIEPFAGSACLFFALEPQRAVLGDLNKDLIQTYRAIRNNVDSVIESIKALPTGKDAYYLIREMVLEEMSTDDRAARFVYLNHYCFNGLYRTNSKGKFNVPYGPPKSGFPVNEALIRDAHRVLKHATFVAGDFSSTLAKVKEGDFVYLDPPYFIEERRVFSQYLPGSFHKADLQTLKACLKCIDEAGASFLITYEESKEGRDLLSDWDVLTVDVRRNISGFSNSRRSSRELLTTNLKHGYREASHLSYL